MFGYCQGMTLHGLCQTLDEADNKARSLEIIYINNSPQNGYTVAFNPGELKLSEIYPDQICVLKGEDARDGLLSQAFDYVQLEDWMRDYFPKSA
jgi:hypothetical protein